MRKARGRLEGSVRVAGLRRGFVYGRFGFYSVFFVFRVGFCDGWVVSDGRDLLSDEEFRARLGWQMGVFVGCGLD